MRHLLTWVGATMLLLVSCLALGGLYAPSAAPPGSLTATSDAVGAGAPRGGGGGQAAGRAGGWGRGPGRGAQLSLPRDARSAAAAAAAGPDGEPLQRQR